EDRQHDPGGDPAHPCAEAVGVRLALTRAGHGGHDHAEQHAGDGGVDARGVHARPGDDTDRDEQPPGGDAAAHEHGEDGDGEERGAEEQEVQAPGEDDGDDDDPDEVVDDGEGEEEGAQRRREAAAEDAEQGDGEGDVGGHRHRPPVPDPRPGDGLDDEVDGDRPRDTEERRDHRHGCGPDVTQRAGDELLLELQTDDEEEDGEQPVGGPGGEAEVEVEACRSEGDTGQVRVDRPPGGVGPHEREQRRREEDHPGEGLVAQLLAVGGERAASGGLAGHGGRPFWGRKTACAHLTGTWGRTAGGREGVVALPATGVTCGWGYIRPIVVGSQTESCGTNTTTSSARMMARRNGHSRVMTGSMRSRAIRAPTKSTLPTGGVITPTERFITTIAPKWTGSTPNSVTIGRKIGTKMRMAGVGSMKVPTASRTTIMMMRTTTLESVKPSTASEMMSGIRAKLMTKDSAVETATSSMTMAVV